MEGRLGNAAHTLDVPVRMPPAGMKAVTRRGDERVIELYSQGGTPIVLRLGERDFQDLTNQMAYEARPPHENP